MSIEFVAVARNSVILATYGTASLERDVQAFLEQTFVINEQRRTNYHIFTFYKGHSLNFVCSSPPEGEKQIPLRFLEILANRWASAFPDLPPTAAAHSMTRKAEPLIAAVVAEVAASPTDRLKQELDETDRVLKTSLQKAFGRGEDLQILTDNSQCIMASSEDFRIHAKNLKNKMFCQYVKSWAITIIAIALLIYFLLRFICGGWTLKRCRPGSRK
jgi:hypothetical protein